MCAYTTVYTHYRIETTMENTTPSASPIVSPQTSPRVSPNSSPRTYHDSSHERDYAESDRDFLGTYKAIQQFLSTIPDSLQVESEKYKQLAAGVRDWFGTSDKVANIIRAWLRVPDTIGLAFENPTAPSHPDTGFEVDVLLQTRNPNMLFAPIGKRIRVKRSQAS